MVDVEVDPGPWRLHEAGSRSTPRSESAHHEGPDPHVDAPAFRLELLGLAGHSPGQVGLAVYEESETEPSVIFCGDAVFPAGVWAKHGFVYFCDIEASLDAIRRLASLSPATLVAGHGVARGSGVASLLKANEERLIETSIMVEEAVKAHADGVVSEELLVTLAQDRGITLASPPDHVLARATIHAHLSYLESEGRIALRVRENRLEWLALDG